MASRPCFFSIWPLLDSVQSLLLSHKTRAATKMTIARHVPDDCVGRRSWSRQPNWLRTDPIGANDAIEVFSRFVTMQEQFGVRIFGPTIAEIVPSRLSTHKRMQTPGSVRYQKKITGDLIFWENCSKTFLARDRTPIHINGHDALFRSRAHTGTVALDDRRRSLLHRPRRVTYKPNARLRKTATGELPHSTNECAVNRGCTVRHGHGANSSIVSGLANCRNAGNLAPDFATARP